MAPTKNGLSFFMVIELPKDVGVLLTAPLTAIHHRGNQNRNANSQEKQGHRRQPIRPQPILPVHLNATTHTTTNLCRSFTIDQNLHQAVQQNIRNHPIKTVNANPLL